MERIRKYRDQLLQALSLAGFNPEVIHHFLELQVDVSNKINSFNKETLSKEAYIRNEIRITQVSMLKDLLDTEEDWRWNSFSETEQENANDAGEQIRIALRDAGLDPAIIKEFIEVQLSIYTEVNQFNRRKLSQDEYMLNKKIAHQLTLLKDVL